MTLRSPKLRDYCANCLHRHGRERIDTLTEPAAVRWDGGPGLLAHYRCPKCAHQWTCAWGQRIWAGAA